MNNAQQLQAALNRIGGPPASSPQQQVLNRDVGTYLDDSLSVNSIIDRFKVLSHPLLRQAYEKSAREAGLQFGSNDRLSPLIYAKSTPISTETATHPGLPISLNADVPTQSLRFYFQDPVFIRRCTATVIAPRFNAAGLPEPNVQLEINPADYIYVRMVREGNNDQFMTEFIPLSQVSGDGGASYFWNLIPMVRNGGAILWEVTIIPPGQDGVIPFFVDRIGLVSISLHCERFNPFGV